MNLAEKIKECSFFKNRTIIETETQSGIVLIGYRENDQDLYSTIVATQKLKIM